VADSFGLVVIGQAAFGESVLNALVERGERIAGVFAPPDKPGKPADAIKAAAESRGVPVFQFPRMRSPEAIEAVRKLNADLGVMAFVTDIVPEEILKAPRLGTIQYHPSLLPKHRGPSSINWPIIQGETETGLSIFWPDAGLDTGPILMQKRVAIGPDDTLGTIYFDQLFPIGVAAMVESVKLVKSGRAPKEPQDETQATYEGWCRAENCIVDWSQPAQTVHNLIRGADPSPGASSTRGGEVVGLFGSRLAGDLAGAPGAIVEIGSGGVAVAAGAGAVRIAKVRPGSAGKKLDAAEWAQGAGLKAGDRLGA
jgi:methionyl-tRNA formyltransferase